MLMRIVSALLVLTTAGSFVGCTPATGGDATKLEPGLTQLADGSAQAIGTLEYRDLEGGMWVILGGSQAAGGAAKTVAVIANARDIGSTLQTLEGNQVIAKGTKLDGASIRMAGPEIIVTSIVKAEGAAVPAQ